MIQGDAAVVSGASGGIGRAIALRLAREGRPVVVGYGGDRALAEAVVAEIEAVGGQAAAMQADVADPDGVRRLFDDAEVRFGAPQVVVHSAGMMKLAAIAPGATDVFDRTVATNLRGAWLMLGEAASRLGEGGRIIALSTSVIASAPPSYGAYVASKAGVESLVHVLAKELRGRGVTVNAVAPGPTATALFLNGKTDAEIERLAKAAPLERLGQPEDIAGVVAFLSGPDAGWIHGQVIRVNGGFA
jgi:3-oxoacyl-[acyl-carrier protein] reductase